MRRWRTETGWERKRSWKAGALFFLSAFLLSSPSVFSHFCLSFCLRSGDRPGGGRGELLLAACGLFEVGADGNRNGLYMISP